MPQVYLNWKRKCTLGFAIDMGTDSKIFFWEGDQHFFRRFFTGAFIAIVMTGLDQDMMQKNLSCKNIKEAQKNMVYFSISLIFVNLMFLCLGALLYSIAGKYDIQYLKPDDLFPAVVLSETLGFPIIIIFILGLIAAAYSDTTLMVLTYLSGGKKATITIKLKRNQNEMTMKLK